MSKKIIYIFYSDMNESLISNGNSISKVLQNQYIGLRKISHHGVSYKFFTPFNNASKKDYKDFEFPNYVNLFLKKLIKIIPYRIKKLVFGTSSSLSIENLLKTGLFIRFLTKKSDLFIIHGSHKFIINLKWCFQNRKVIYYHHGGTLLRIPKKQLSLLSKVVSNRIISVSKSAIIPFKSGNNKMQYIHNGIDPKTFEYHNLNHKKIRKEIRKKYQIRSDELCFLTGGSMKKEKGYDLLLDCVSKLEFNRKIKIFIVGDITKNVDLKFFNKLKKIADGENLSVKFLGNLSQSDLYDVILASDIGFHLSKPELAEGISIFLLEMTFLGLSVIASDSGGNNEIIKNKYSGIILERYDINSLSDSIKSVLNKNDRQNLAINAKKNAFKNFTNIQMVKKLHNYIEREIES